MGKWSQSQIYQDTRGTNRFTRFVGWLNNLMNPNHSWVDDWQQFSEDVGPSEDIEKQITKSGLTGAEKEANAFSASEAQKQRDYETEMQNTAYQRQVADMRAAGVNPALAMNNGGAAAPSGSTAAGVQPQGQALNFSDLMQLMMLKPQIRLMEKQGQAVEDQGKAALATSEANTKNAETNRRSQIVDALLANNQVKIGDSIRQLNEAQMEEIAQRIRESASRMELQAVEKLAKELQYEFDSQTFEANKELVLQQLVYRAVEMSEMRSVIALNNELKENASNQVFHLASRHSPLAHY